MKTIKFKTACVSIITAVIFIMQSIIIVAQAQAAHPEPGCWNTGTLVYPEGGTEDDKIPHNPNEKGEPYAKEPINITNGSFEYKHKDIQISGRGMPVEIVRTYNNKDKYDGPFGPGWNHSYNIQLIEVLEGSETVIVRRNGGGRREYFTLQADGTYTHSSGCYDMLIRQANGYRIYTPQKTIYEFDFDGRLTSITDSNDNRITFQYSSGRLATITDTVGRTMTIEYGTNSKISSITDCIGRITGYQYNNTDDLASVTTPGTTEYPQGLTTTYSYTNHNLETIRDAKGQVYLINQYDNKGRVIVQTYGGDITNLSYDNNTRTTTAVDAKNNTVSWTYNNDDLLINKTEYIYGLSQGYITRYEYNNNRECAKIIYPRGNVIQYTYNDTGGIIEIRKKIAEQPNSASDIVYTYTYEPIYNKIRAYADPEGNTYTCTFDYQEGTDYAGLAAKIDKTAQETQNMLASAGVPMGLGDINGDNITSQINGNIIKIQYPDITRGVINPPQAIRYLVKYNQYGQIDMIIDPLNIRTKLEYNSNYYLNQITKDSEGLNLIIGIDRDTVGNITKITDPKNNATTFTVNEQNQIRKIISPVPYSYQTVITYDPNGNITQIDEQTNDPADPWQTTVATYTILDKIETITDELNNVTTCTYDPNGNLHTITDAEQKETTYDYNFRDQISAVTDALNNITSYTYDGNSNLKTITDANSNQTTYHYDLYDRLQTIVYPDNTTESYAYDKSGNTTTLTKRNNDVITYRYDEINRLYRKEYPDNTNALYIYDALSRLTNIVNPKGTTTIYTYDNLSRVQSATANSKTISYQYDKNSNRTRITYPDNLGYFTYIYDELNRLTDIKDSADNNIAHYTYDALSLINTLTYLNSTVTDYNYDALSQLTDILRSTGNINYTYDNVGSKSAMTDSRGQFAYDYDDIYQLTNVSGVQSFSFAYDNVGNRTSATNGTTTNYTTNNLNQYTVIASGSEAISCTYDTNGNLTNNGANTYAYDYENCLTSVIASGSEAISCSYDGFGRRIQKINRQTGEQVNYLYDGDNLLVEYNQNWQPVRYYTYTDYIDEPITVTNANGTYYYHQDGLGSITHITNSTGSLVESYTYDVFGRPTIRDSQDTILTTSSIGNRFMFTGREYDTETSLYYYRARYYDPTIGRFLQTDPIDYWDSMNLYQYCNNNPVNWTDPWGLWKESIHNDIIDSAFKDLPKEVRDALKEGSRNADAPENQDLKHSYIHGMRCPGQTVAEAKRKMEKFIEKQINKSKKKECKGDTAGANEALGEALHPIMDITSPSHEGFQEWKGVLFHLPSAVRHVYRERSIDSKTKQRTVDIIKGYVYKRL